MELHDDADCCRVVVEWFSIVEYRTLSSTALSYCILCCQLPWSDMVLLSVELWRWSTNISLIGVFAEASLLLSRLRVV